MKWCLTSLAAGVLALVVVPADAAPPRRPSGGARPSYRPSSSRPSYSRPSSSRPSYARPNSTYSRPAARTAPRVTRSTPSAGRSIARPSVARGVSRSASSRRPASATVRRSTPSGRVTRSSAASSRRTYPGSTSPAARGARSTRTTPGRSVQRAASSSRAGRGVTSRTAGTTRPTKGGTRQTATVARPSGTAARGMTVKRSALVTRSAERGLNPAVQQAITAKRNDTLAKIDSLLPATPKQGTTIQMPKLPWVDPGPLNGQAAAPAPASPGDVYWVSFSRSDTPKAYELYSAYKTKAEADKAAQDIRNWAARTGWKVADIQIEKDGGSPAKSATASAAGAGDKHVTYADLPAGTGSPKSAADGGWLKNAYNPPANLPPPPSFRAPSAPAAAPSPAAAMGSVAAESRQAIEQDISALRGSGGLRTSGEVSVYRQQRLQQFGADLARYNRIAQQAQKVEGFFNKVEKLIANEFQDPPHPANEIAKKMLKQGIEQQERERVDVPGEQEFNQLLKGMFKNMKDMLKSPLDIFREQLNEKMEGKPKGP